MVLAWSPFDHSALRCAKTFEVEINRRKKQEIRSNEDDILIHATYSLGPIQDVSKFGPEGKQVGATASTHRITRKGSMNPEFCKADLKIDGFGPGPGGQRLNYAHRQRKLTLKIPPGSASSHSSLIHVVSLNAISYAGSGAPI